MSDKPEQEQGHTEREQESIIVIEFARPGDAEPQTIQRKAVSASQLLVAAKWLQLMADKDFEQMWPIAVEEGARAQQALRVSKAD